MDPRYPTPSRCRHCWMRCGSRSHLTRTPSCISHLNLQFLQPRSANMAHPAACTGTQAAGKPCASTPNAQSGSSCCRQTPWTPSAWPWRPPSPKCLACHPPRCRPRPILRRRGRRRGDGISCRHYAVTCREASCCAALAVRCGAAAVVRRFRGVLHQPMLRCDTICCNLRYVLCSAPTATTQTCVRPNRIFLARTTRAKNVRVGRTHF